MRRQIAMKLEFVGQILLRQERLPNLFAQELTRPIWKLICIFAVRIYFHGPNSHQTTTTTF